MDNVVNTIGWGWGENKLLHEGSIMQLPKLSTSSNTVNTNKTNHSTLSFAGFINEKKNNMATNHP